MKKIIIIFYLFVFYQLTDCYSFEYATCCSFITHSIQVNNLCCVQINVTNPSCTNPRVGFFKFNPNNGQYQWIQDRTCPAGQTVSQIICPSNGETTLITRIRFYDEGTNHAACMGGQDIWNDGFNQYTDTTDLSNCCPCPDNKNSWLNVLVQKDRTCSGCKVTITGLDIPENIDCYNNYVIGYPNQTLSQLKSFINNPISGTSFCIGNNSSADFQVYLMKGASYNLDSACVINKHVVCDSTAFDPEDSSTSSSCLIDCPDSVWKGPLWRTYTLPSGCVVRIKYEYRFGCPPENYQDLKIDNVEIIGNCNGMTDKEIFQQATIELIKANPMGFQPLPNQSGCNYVWRITIKSCWKTIAVWNSGLHYVLVNCDSAVCCYQQYRVCNDPNLIFPLTIYKIGDPYIQNDINCITVDPQVITDPHPPYESICHTTCDWLDIEYSSSPVPPQSTNISEESKLLDESIFENDGKVKIDVFNIMGKLILSREVNNFKQLNILKPSDLVEQKGVYFYKIYQNNLLLKTGKIIR